MGIALRRRADAPYMRRWQYLLPCQKLSTKDDTPHVGQQHLQIFVVSGATGGYCGPEVRFEEMWVGEYGSRLRSPRTPFLANFRCVVGSFRKET